MWKWLIILLPSLSFAGQHIQQNDTAGGDLTGTYPNPTISASVSLPGYIKNQSTLQSGATFYVTSGTVAGLFSVNGNINTYGDIFMARGVALDLYAPNNTNVAYIYNPTNSKSAVKIDAVDGITMTGPFTTSSGTASNFNTNQIQFQANGNMMLYKDGTVLFSIPSVQETFFGYNTNLVNTGGVFNTAFGAGAMPYPNTGNFNNCFGNSCMGGGVLTSDNNNGMGYGALASLTGGSYNNSMGGSSMQVCGNCVGNTGVGAISLAHVITGVYNSAIGYRSLFWTLGDHNIGIGFESGTSTDTANANTSGDHNIFIGTESGKDLSTQLTNAGAFGYRAYVHKSNSLQLGGQLGSGTEWEVITTSLTVQSALVISKGGSSGQTVCWKTATTLGYCSSVVGVGGACTCN